MYRMNDIDDRRTTARVYIGIPDIEYKEDVLDCIMPLLEGYDVVIEVKQTNGVRTDVLIPFGPTNLVGETQTFKRDIFLASLITRRIHSIIR